MLDRICSKPTCAREAVATLSYDYAGATVAVGPLSPERAPHGYDLCAVHAETLSVPMGWRILRHRPTEAAAPLPAPGASGGPGGSGDGADGEA